MKRLFVAAALAALACGAAARAADAPAPDPVKTPAPGIPVVELPPQPKMLPGQASAPPEAPRLPIVLRWAPRVGEPGQEIPSAQAGNEALTRHVLVRRLDDDDGRRILVVRWRVTPDAESPAPPELFGEGGYPSGIVVLGPRQASADVAVRCFPTGRPSRAVSFTVTLNDSETGAPVLSDAMIPVEVSFLVTGDLDRAESDGGQAEDGDAPADQKR